MEARYNYFYSCLEATGSDEFGHQITAALATMARDGAELVHLSSSSVVTQRGVLHIAHLIARVLIDPAPARTPTLPASGLDA